MSPNIILLLNYYKRPGMRRIYGGKGSRPLTIIRSTQRFGGRPAGFAYATGILADAYGYRA